MTCAQCGSDTGTDSKARRLVRFSSRGRIAGVCAGIAGYLGIDVVAVRVAWVVFSIVPGGIVFGIVAYIAAWLIMPDDKVSAAADHESRLTRSTTDRKVAGVCGGIAEFLGVDATAVRVGWIVLTIVPGAIVFGAVAYLAAWFIMPERNVSSLVATPHAA
jgi:phage shock protein PspC (stress-responsive transcriptional regulator)